MAERLHLTEAQEIQKNNITTSMEVVRTKNSNHDFDEEFDTAFANMTDTAYELAISLETPPVFTEAVLRGAENLTPNDREFYNHFHAVEDLLNYLDDPDANNSPEDVTLNQSFEFRVHTNRWGHYDTYHIVRNEEGWHISHKTYSEQGSINAASILNNILQHDSVSYPYQLNDYMENTWYNANNGASYEQIQRELSAISEWISTTERNKPYML